MVDVDVDVVVGTAVWVVVGKYPKTTPFVVPPNWYVVAAATSAEPLSLYTP